MSHPTFYSAEQLQEYFNFTYRDTLNFSDASTKQRFLRCYEKGKKQADAFSLWQGAFYSRDIEKAGWPPISIRWIDETIGFGVFAEEDLSAKMFLGEYTGMICQRTWRFKFNLYCMAFLREVSGFRKFLINGEESGNFTRFFNHSYQPNLLLQTVYTETMPHMIFTALRSIRKGEQLTFDYGESYWRQCQKIPKVL